jgi:hypothetical protein
VNRLALDPRSLLKDHVTDSIGAGAKRSLSRFQGMPGSRSKKIAKARLEACSTPGALVVRERTM